MRIIVRDARAPAACRALLLGLLTGLVPDGVQAQPAITSRGSISASVDALPNVDATELRVRVEDTIDVEIDRRWILRAGSWVDAFVGTRRDEDESALVYQPGEIYARYRHEAFDLTAGFQRVVWGTLDEIQPTDVVNPIDVSRFLFQGRSEARLPVFALRARAFLAGDTTIEAVYVPFFRRGRSDLVDEPTSPFNLLADTCRGGLCDVDLPATAAGGSARLPLVSSEPARTARNGSVGARVTRPLAGIDVGVSVYRGWQAFPLVSIAAVAAAVPSPAQAAADVGAAPPALALRESWSRITMVGGDVEAAHGAITWRAEGAILVDTPVQERAGGPVRDGRSVQVGAGLDWTAGPWRTFANAIVRRSWARGADAAAVPSAGGVQLVGGAERRFARDTRLVRGFAVVDPGEGTGFVRGLGAWNLRDNVWIEAAAGAFAGDGTDFLGQFTDRDFITVGVRYHF